MTFESKNANNSSTDQDKPDPDFFSNMLERLAGSKGNLIPLLQCAQGIYGYLPAEIIKLISAHTGHSLSTIYGVASFYSQFRLYPAGKLIIRVCHGTACHVQNANAIGQALQDELRIGDGCTTEDRIFTLETVACLGCCSLAPVMMIGDETFGNLTPAGAVKVVREIRKREGGAG
jgi:NADH-quinone oxidoreductase subunit E